MPGAPAPAVPSAGGRGRAARCRRRGSEGPGLADSPRALARRRSHRAGFAGTPRQMPSPRRAASRPGRPTSEASPASAAGPPQAGPPPTGPPPIAAPSNNKPEPSPATDASPPIIQAWRVRDELEARGDADRRPHPNDYAPQLWSQLNAGLVALHLEQLGLPHAAGRSDSVEETIARYQRGLDQLVAATSGNDAGRLTTDELCRAATWPTRHGKINRQFPGLHRGDAGPASLPGSSQPIRLLARRERSCRGGGPVDSSAVVDGAEGAGPQLGQPRRKRR